MENQKIKNKNLKTNKQNTRVIAGSKRGLKLDNPQKITRPLTDRIKMSLFDLISQFIDDAKVLDLYAGGGNFGIEALSRGAKHVDFVDLSDESIKIIMKNLERAGFSDQAKITQTNVQDFLRAEENTSRNFDIIFADPPFEHVIIEHIQDAAELLHPKGVLILRTPAESKQESPERLSALTRTYLKKYGKSILSFYQKT